MTERWRLEAWRQKGQVHSFEGHPIFFRQEVGAGNPTLLCIHGFPTASWDWHRLWPLLEGHYRLLAPDLIGYGFSAKPRDFPYSIARQADLCEQLCLSLGHGSVHLLAHDYGDTVAQELLARQNQGSPRMQVLSACFLNGGLFPEANRPRLIQKLLASPLGPLLIGRLSQRRFRRSFSAIFAKGRQPTGDELDEFWRLVNWNEGRAVVPRVIQYLKERDRFRDRWVGALTNSSIPMRLIDGTQDSISGINMVRRYRELIPRADVVEIPEAAHYPQLEAPERVATALLGWSRG